MSLARAFATVGGMTLISRVTGLAREMMLASLLGAGAAAEAFFVAFRLPNMFRRFFAEGAFNMAFVPLFARRLEGEGEAAARDFAEEAMAGLLSVLFVLTLLAQLAMPWLVLAIAYGFVDDPEKFSLAVLFSRIQFPYLLFMSLTALFAGVLNSLGKFAAAAGAPVLLNILMIAFMAVAWALDADIGLWLAWSVFAGGVAQVAVVYIAARRAGIRLRLRRPRWSPGVSRLVKLGLPGALAGGVMQINLLIGTLVATFFDGAVAWLNYADRIYQLPLGVVGVAIGVALLPEMSRRLRAGDGEGTARALSDAIEFSLVLSLPAAAALIAMPDEIVRLLFGRGAFLAADVAETSMALSIFALGLPAYVLIKALSPAYFAQEDTKTPLRYAAAAMALNTAISAGLAPVISWIAIPIGTAIAAWLNVWLLWRGIRRGAGFDVDAEVKGRVAWAALASLVMGALLASLTVKLGPQLTDPTWSVFTTLALVATGFFVFAALAVASGAVRPGALRRMFRRERA